MRIDHTKSVTMPVRDFADDGKIKFYVTVYGVVPRDIATVCMGPPPDSWIGTRPFVKAIKRLGLDPNRFQAMIWDIP